MRSACWFVFGLLVGAVAVGGAACAQENRGYLGVELQNVTKEEADKLGWEAPRGVRVVKPREGGPGAIAGILAEDIITSLDGQDVENMARFVASIGDRGAGAQIRLRLVRGGKERTIAVMLGKRPAELAQTATPEKRDMPILQLDTGGHMGFIKGLAFTPDGRHLVSAGGDKVIRVWDWRDGTIVRSIRGHVGPGQEGQVSAMALSPNGRWLVAGGLAQVECAGRCGEIRLHEFATGRLVALLKGHINSIYGLAFSLDGKRLISGGADFTAVIWDVEQRTPVHRLYSHTDHIYGVGFSPDGARAITSSYDKTLKLWSVADGSLITTLSGHQAQVHAMAVSTADGIIASGSLDGEIKLWDSRDGRFLRTLAKQGGAVSVLKFSSDGKQLLSTCGYTGCNNTQRLWEVTTGKELLAYVGNDNSVPAAALSPDGQVAATAGGNQLQIDLWNAQSGQLERRLAGKGAARFAAAFSTDGRRIAWGGTWAYTSEQSRGPLEFQLRLPQAGGALGVPEKVSSAAASFLPAHITHGNLSVKLSNGGDYGRDRAILDVIRDGKAQTSITRGATDGFRHIGYTFAPDGQSLISGGDGGALIGYDIQGKELGRFVGHEGGVWAVTPSPDGRLLVSGSGDQTIRLWNLKTRELIVTLFHGSDGEWVMWTPQGYYTGSPGADKMVGWQINKGPENAADYVGADQLRQHLNRPDIIDKAIILASAEQAVAESPGTSFKLSDLLSKPVPRFRIVSPAPGSGQRGGRTQVKIAIEAVPDPIKAIRVQVNGRQVSEITPEIGSGGIKAGEHDLDVPLGKGRNHVRITLANAVGEKAEAITLNHEGDGDLDKRGTLYILAIGVDRYPAMGNTCGSGSQSCDLRFAGADARAWADAAERRLGSGHLKVVKQVLVNGGSDKDAPTAGNIIDAIDALRQSAEDTDTVLLFIAGHGMNDGADYRFLATNAERTSSGALRGSTVVPWQTLQGSMEATKGRRVLFVDTCHSGNAYSAKLGNSAYHANIITYASARFDQEALEDAQLGHGLFTYAVAEGLAGKGELGDKREITTKGLAEFVIKRVDQFAKDMKGSQEPQYFRGRDAEDYVLARW